MPIATWMLLVTLAPQALAADPQLTPGELPSAAGGPALVPPSLWTAEPSPMVAPGAATSPTPHFVGAELDTAAAAGPSALAVASTADSTPSAESAEGTESTRASAMDLSAGGGSALESQSATAVAAEHGHTPGEPDAQSESDTQGEPDILAPSEPAEIPEAPGSAAQLPPTLEPPGAAASHGAEAGEVDTGSVETERADNGGFFGRAIEDGEGEGEHPPQNADIENADTEQAATSAAANAAGEGETGGTMDAQLLAELRTLAAAQAQAQAGQEQGAGPAPAASRTRRALQLLLLVLLLACALCCLFRGGRWCGLCAGWCDAVHEAYDAVHDAASDDGSHLPLVASQPPSPTSKRKPPRVCLSLQLLVARARAFARARAGRFGSAAAVGVGGKRESDVEMQPHKRRQTPSRVLQLREAREQRWDSPGMMRGLSLPSLSKMVSELWVPRLLDSTSDPPALISGDQIRAVCREVLPRRYGIKDWRLIYSTEQHGCSLHTAYSRSSECGSGPCVMLLLDTAGCIFGAYCSTAPRPDGKYQGTGETCLFRVEPHFAVYRWSQANDLFALGGLDFFAFGSGPAFGLRVDDSFEHGSSGRSHTYENECLASAHEFRIVKAEWWGFD